MVSRRRSVAEIEYFFDCSLMARLRRDTGQMHPQTAPQRPLRIFATGTVFFTHTLLLPAYPLPGSASRAQAVHTSRGGTSGHVLALLAQLSAASPSFGDVEPMLIASLGGNTDALRLRDALESSGVRTKYCKVWPGLGVPCAWVMHARDSGERTVINHNPLPEVSHEDFIALLGPVLAPENYIGYPQPQLQPPTGNVREQHSSSPVPLFPNALAPSAPRPSVSSRPNTSSSTNSNPSTPHAHMVPSQSPHSPAPFDWLHFEGRSIRTTVANIVGVDGLARERKWRPHCVVSVDLGRRAREGVEVVRRHLINPRHPLTPRPSFSPMRTSSFSVQQHSHLSHPHRHHSSTPHRHPAQYSSHLHVMLHPMPFLSSMPDKKVPLSSAFPPANISKAPAGHHHHALPRHTDTPIPTQLQHLPMAHKPGTVSKACVPVLIFGQAHRQAMFRWHRGTVPIRIMVATRKDGTVDTAHTNTVAAENHSIPSMMGTGTGT